MSTGGETQYAVAKQSILAECLAEACKDDPSDITDRVMSFADDVGITDPVIAAQMVWMMVGERERCARRARKAARDGYSPTQIAKAVSMRP